MRQAPRTTDGQSLTRWLPQLERLETREVPAVTANLSQVAQWTDIGPNAMTNGQVRSIGGNSTAIGAVQAMAFDPTNSSTLFAAAPNGGIWRTTDANAASPVWVPIADQVASLSIADIAIDPDNPNRLVAAVGGTADGYQVELGGQPIRGDLIGLIYTENALAATPTWRFLSNNLAGKNVTHVFIRTGYILAATDQGTFRSTDNGQTFTNIFGVSTDNGVTFPLRQFNQSVYDFAENPRLRNQFYLATRPAAGFANSEIWRTDNGGATWGRVTDAAQMQMNARTVSVQLSVRDLALNDNQVYVAVSNNNPQTADEQSLPGLGVPFGWVNRLGVLTSICWSTNQGGNWTRMDAPRQMTDPDPLDYGVRDPDGRGMGVAVKNVGGGADINSGVVTIITRIEHRLRTGDRVFVRGLFQWEPANPPLGELVNGFFTVTVTGTNTFTLDGVNLNVGGLDSTRGYWQRVVGATPGERGEFLQIATSNLVGEQDLYLGGDFSQYKFEDFSDNAFPSATAPFGFAFGDPNIPTYPGLNNYYPGLDDGATPATQFANPTTYSGGVWRGDRFQVPSFTGGSSSQWSTITDTPSSNPNRTAPGGDTREMQIVNSAGQTTLWISTGTGIYRRPVGVGDWTSANGNLGVGQFWSASYDNLTNVVAGATQDTGMVQSGAGSTAYIGINSTAYRNFLLDQEYAYDTQVDNTSLAAQNRSIRYYSSSDFGNIRRRVYDNANNLTVFPGESTLNLANALTTNVPLSGISILDRSLARDPGAKIVMELNANDRRRGVYGLTSVYEDSDPLGPGSQPETGFVVSNVTPPGMTGRVSSMSYGGKRAGINFNQVLAVGTSSGQLWLRGEFGVTFNQVSPLGAGAGDVTDVELDPDDWRHIFAVQAGRVFRSTNAGQNWEEVSSASGSTAALVTPADPLTGLPTAGGLTTQIRTIALFDPNRGTANVGTTGDVVLLAGGRGGVFRRSLSACGTSSVWSEYGNGLPNTVVTELQFDSTGNRLTAATFGRGVWTVPDVRPTLNNTLYLDIVGDAAANTITIAADPSDPNAVIVSDGLGGSQKFLFGQFDIIRVYGLGGADTLRVGSASVPGTSVKFVNYPILVGLGGDAGDRIVVNASGDTANIQATITPTTIGAGTGDTLFSGCGYIYTDPLTSGSLWLFTGSGNDVITYTGGGPMPGVIAALGGAGNDTYRFVNSGPTAAYIYDSAGTDAVIATVPAGTMAIADDPNKRVVAGGVDIVMDAGVESVLLDAQGAGATLGWYGSNAADSVNLMEDPAAPSVWSQLLSPRQLVRFRNMTAVSVNTFGGPDNVRIDSNGGVAGGTTQFVRYATTVNLGGNAGDVLVIDSSSSATNIVAGVTGSSVGVGGTLFGAGGYVGYTGLAAGSALYLSTGSGNDQLFFDAGISLVGVVNTGAGNDAVSALGTAGSDVFTVAGTTFIANNLILQPTTGVERFIANGGAAGFDQLYTSGTAGTEALAIYQTAARGAVLTGLPVTTQYDNLSFVDLNGVGGLDSLDWVDISNLSFGTPIDPGSGLVFAPTGPTSGNLTLGGAAGTTTRISNVGGTFALNGDPSGTNTRDVFTILGASSSAFGSSLGELVSPNGADVISATDAGVSVNNAVFGLLKPVAFGRSPGGALGFSSVFVRGGNEVGQGDTVFATTTTRTNLVIDGGEPSAIPGDTINITTNGAASSTLTTDPAFGPPQTRVTNRIDGGAVGHLNFENVTAGFVDPTNPTGPTIPSFNSPIVQLFVAGTDVGAPSLVRVYNPDGGLRFQLDPFPGFFGGVRVATGDVTGDGVTDIVVAAGPGGGPIVKVYSGATGGEVYAFYAFDPGFVGGVSLGVGLVNNDRFADIVVGVGPGAAPHVKVFDGLTLGELHSFYAFDPSFTGGVNVAAGDVNGDGADDVVVGTATSTPAVAAFDGRTGGQVAGFVAFDPATTSGVNVAAGDIDGDGRADIITGAGPGGATVVRVFDLGGGVLRDFVVNDPTIPGTPPITTTTGVRVSAGDLDGDGLSEVVAGRGPGSRPFLQFLKVSNNVGPFVSPVLTSLLAVNVFGDQYSNGIFVGA